MMADDSTLLSDVSELDTVPPQSQTLTEQRLKYWFRLADPQTRHHFCNGRKNSRPLDMSCPSAQFFVFLLQHQALPVICRQVNYGIELWN